MGPKVAGVQRAPAKWVCWLLVFGLLGLRCLGCSAGFRFYGSGVQGFKV